MTYDVHLALQHTPRCQIKTLVSQELRSIKGVEEPLTSKGILVAKYFPVAYIIKLFPKQKRTKFWATTKTNSGIFPCFTWLLMTLWTLLTCSLCPPPQQQLGWLFSDLETSQKKTMPGFLRVKWMRLKTVLSWLTYLISLWWRDSSGKKMKVSMETHVRWALCYQDKIFWRHLHFMFQALGGNTEAANGSINRAPNWLQGFFAEQRKLPITESSWFLNSSWWRSMECPIQWSCDLKFVESHISHQSEGHGDRWVTH